MSKNILKWKIKTKLKNEKNLKNLPIWSLGSLILHDLVGQRGRLIQPYSPIPVGEVETHRQKARRNFFGTWVP